MENVRSFHGKKNKASLLLKSHQQNFKKVPDRADIMFIGPPTRNQNSDFEKHMD